MTAPLSRIPLLWPLGGFVAGILLNNLLPDYAVIIAVAALIAATGAYIFKRHFVTLMCVAASIGIIDAWASAPASIGDEGSMGGKHVAEVIDARERESGTEIDCMVDGVYKTRLFYLSATEVIEPGARIEFEGELRAPTSSLDLPDEFDYGAYLRRNGFAATAVVAPDDMVSIGEGHGFRYFVGTLRDNLARNLASTGLDDDTVEFLMAALLGDSSTLTDETRDELSQAGLGHVLALSGLHVGIIAILLGLLFYPLTATGMRRSRIVALIAGLWAFALLTGMGASVVRAVIMATFVLAGRLIERESSPINSLCAAALVILLFSPDELYSIGFQLSFSAVAAILLIADKMNQFSRKRWVAHALMSYACASAAAMSTAGVLLLIYFHRFPVYFLLGNVVAALLLPLLIGGGMAVMLLSTVVTVPRFMVDIVDWLYDATEGVASLIASLPGAVIDDIYISPWTLLPALATFGFATTALYRRRRAWWIYAGITLVITVATAIALRPTYPCNEYFITRNTYETTIVVHDGDSLYLVTTAPEVEHAAVIDKAERRYRDYRGRRGLRGFSIAGDTVTSPYFKRRCDWMEIGGEKLLIVHSDEPIAADQAPIDYMIVARGFTGDIIELHDRLRPDSIIISADVNRRRASRYERECREAGAACRLMRASE